MVQEEHNGNMQKSQNPSAKFSICIHLRLTVHEAAFWPPAPPCKSTNNLFFLCRCTCSPEINFVFTSINCTSGGDLKALYNLKITSPKFANEKNRGTANSSDLPIFTPKYSNLSSLKGRGGLIAVFKNFQVQNFQNFHISTGFVFQISPIKRWVKRAFLCMKTDLVSATSWWQNKTEKSCTKLKILKQSKMKI